MPEPNKLTIDISLKSLLKIAAIVVGVYFLYAIGKVIVMIFVALILVSTIAPIVDYLEERYHIPRILSILGIYLIILLFFAFVFFLIIPPLVSQIKQITQIFPEYSQKIADNIAKIKLYSDSHNNLLGNIDLWAKQLNGNITGGIQGIFNTIVGIFGGIASFVAILVITFYMMIEKKAIVNFFDEVAPKHYKSFLIKLASRLQEKMGWWLRAQLILGLAIFALTFLALTIFKIKYALVLAIIAGSLEFIPYFGPILSVIPAVMLTILISPFHVLLVLIIYFAIQQFENHILVPNIMRSVVGVNPILSVLALITGFRLFGPIGAVLSIPFAVAIIVIVEELYKVKYKQT